MEQISMLKIIKKQTSLHYAIMHKCTIEKINLLIDKGANVNDKDENQETPLHYAIKFNCSIKYIILLLNRGANINYNTIHNNKFLNSQGKYIRNVFTEMEANHSVKNIAKEIKGLSPLHYAIRCNSSTDIIKLLINNGSNLEIMDLKRQTLLHYAISYKASFEIINLLILSGANINAKDSRKQTPLHYAIIFDLSIEVIDLLIKNGANINTKDENKQTPLHVAFFYNSSFQIIELLIKRGGDLNIENKKNETPIFCSFKRFPPINFIETLLNKCNNIRTKNKYNETMLHFAFYIRGLYPEYISVLIKRGLNKINYLTPFMPNSNKIQMLYSVYSLFDERILNNYNRLKFIQKSIFNAYLSPSVKKNIKKSYSTELGRTYYYPDLSFITFNNTKYFTKEVFSFYQPLSKVNMSINFVLRETNLNLNTTLKNGLPMFFIIKNKSNNIELYEKEIKWFTENNERVILTISVIKDLIECCSYFSYDEYVEYLKKYRTYNGMGVLNEYFKSENGNNFLHVSCNIVHDFKNVYKDLLFEKNKNGWTPLFKAKIYNQISHNYLSDNTKDYFGNSTIFYTNKTRSNKNKSNIQKCEQNTIFT